MKKIKLSVVAVFLAVAAMAQPVHDMAVVPVGVTLNQVLRLAITRGGNIEFVFHNIEDYKVGLSGEPYQTWFEVSSSTNYNVILGAEDAGFEADDPTNADLALDNVGLYLTTGDVDGGGTNPTYTFGGNITGPATDLAANTDELTTYAAGKSWVYPNGVSYNAGDREDNNFVIHWRCGTAEGNMETSYLYEQDIEPGRYSTNVIIRIEND